MRGYNPLAAFIRNGSVSIQTGPFGSQLHSYDYVDDGVPVIPTEGIRDGRIDHSVLPKISIKKSKELSRHEVAENDILFARRGAQATGRSSRIREEEAGFICGTGAIRLRVEDTEQLNAAFLAWFLSAPATIGWIREQAIGATMPNLNSSIIARIAIPCVELFEQRDIAEILGVLDDKIGLNRRMTRTLEEMARALYRSWFVDYDPVQAKAEGREPAHMDAATAALFPDRFGENGLPEGWHDGTLSDLLEFNPKEKLSKGRIAPYLEMKALPTSGMQGDQPFDREFTSGTKFRAGDTLLARITPCLENGKTALVGEMEAVVGWGSTEFIVMRGRASVPRTLAYCVARDEDFRAEAIASMTGSSGRQRADAGRIAQIPAAIPSDDILLAFGSMVEPWTDVILARGRENQTLAELRDTLLPKLMSGEIRVGEAREMAEAAE